MVSSSLDPRLEVFAGVRVVITGGIGFIGSALARRLVELGAEVMLTDSMIPEYDGDPANIIDICDRVEVNIADIRGGHVMGHLPAGWDFLFNLAPQTSHLDSMSAPSDDLAINCTARNFNCWKHAARSIPESPSSMLVVPTKQMTPFALPSGRRAPSAEAGRYEWC